MLSFIGGFLLMLFLAAATSPLWLFWLARKGSRFSPFTMLEDGTAKIIARGDSFYRAIARLEEHEIVTPQNKRWYPGVELWEIVPRNPEAPQRQSFWEKRFGLYWVGIIFQGLFYYNFRWTTLLRKAQPKEGEASLPYEREETLGHIFVKNAQYWAKIATAETYDKVPVDVVFLVTLRVINPYKALFRVHRWLDVILDMIDQRGRQYIGTRTYEQLVQKEGDDEDIGFSGGVRKLREEVRIKYGVEIVSADILSLDPAGESAEEYRQASTAAYTANAKATAVRTAAEAEAYAIKQGGEARAQAIRDQAKAFSENKEAAQATLNAEVGRTLNVGAITKAIVEGVRSGLKTNRQEQEGGTQ